MMTNKNKNKIKFFIGLLAAGFCAFYFFSSNTLHCAESSASSIIRIKVEELPFEIYPSEVTIYEGENFQFNTRNGSGNITWSSENTEFVSINQSGVVTGIKSTGDSFITITATDSLGRVVRARVKVMKKYVPKTGTDMSIVFITVTCFFLFSKKMKRYLYKSDLL